MGVYTTYNPSDKSANIVLSGGNLTVGNSGSTDQGVRGVDGKTTGKWYFEVLVNHAAGGDTGIGLAIAIATLTTIGSAVTNATITFRSGSIWVNGSGSGSLGFTQSDGNHIDVAFDADNNKVWYRPRDHSSQWNGTAGDDPATNVGGKSLNSFVTPGTTKVYPAICTNNSSDSYTANFGDSAFGGTVPNGFIGWTAFNPLIRTSLANPFIG